MTEFPDDRRYTRAHEWARDEDGHLDITDYAQEQLGDVVEVALPDPGASGDGRRSVEGGGVGEIDSRRSPATEAAVDHV